MKASALPPERVKLNSVITHSAGCSSGEGGEDRVGTVGKDASDAPREELQGALRLVHSEAERRYLARNCLHLTAAEEV